MTKYLNNLENDVCNYYIIHLFQGNKGMCFHVLNIHDSFIHISKCQSYPKYPTETDERYKI